MESASMLEFAGDEAQPLTDELRLGEPGRLLQTIERLSIFLVEPCMDAVLHPDCVAQAEHFVLRAKEKPCGWVLSAPNHGVHGEMMKVHDDVERGSKGSWPERVFGTDIDQGAVEERRCPSK